MSEESKKEYKEFKSQDRVRKPKFVVKLNKLEDIAKYYAK
jgi:hypothetical protein